MPSSRLVINSGGLRGPAGPQGLPGVNGSGVPAGGTTNQVLKKNSNADGDAGWADPAGGGGSGNTNLGTSRTSTAVAVTSDTGTDISIPAADASNAGVMTAAQQTKLSGIATGATANDTDANLKNRANHTGTQAISTVASLQAALDAKQDDVIGTGATAVSQCVVIAHGAATPAGLPDGTIIVEMAT